MNARRRATRKSVQKMLQTELGLTRYEARRSLYGDTRKEATSHATRGAVLVAASAAYRAAKADRKRRLSALAASAATAEAAF